MSPQAGLSAAASGMASAAACCAVQWDGVINDIQFSAPLVGATFSVGVGVTGYTEGPGHTAITGVGDWEFPYSADFPGVCIDHNGKYHGGEGTYEGSNSTWIHSLHTIGVGVGLSSGICENIRSVSAAYRANYAGGWDCYNDWGFGGNYGCGNTTYRQGPYS